jgi:hypothetical protein
MNVATAVATGSHVLFLNAGDTLHPEFSWPALSDMVAEHDPDMIWGRCFDRDTAGRVYERRARGPGWSWLGMPVSHQAIVFRRDTLGPQPFDTAFRFAADYDHLCRLLDAGASVRSFPLPICVFDLEGASSASKRMVLSEESKVRARRGGWLAVVNPFIRLAKGLAWRISERWPATRAWWRSRL